LTGLNASFNLNQSHEAFAGFKALRPYFYGDFYPLIEYSTIVLAFRTPQAAGSSIIVRPHNLEAEGNYDVNFDDYDITLRESGRERMEGLPVKIPEASGSRLIKYRRHSQTD
jgi:hypothetical protein